MIPRRGAARCALVWVGISQGRPQGSAVRLLFSYLISTDLPPVNSPLCKGGPGGDFAGDNSRQIPLNPPLVKGEVALRKIGANHNHRMMWQNFFDRCVFKSQIQLARPNKASSPPLPDEKLTTPGSLILITVTALKLYTVFTLRWEKNGWCHAVFLVKHCINI